MDPAPRPDASTNPAELDRAVADLSEHAQAFARTPARVKADLIRELIPLFERTASEQVAASCLAKGIDPASPTAGEEWLAGPYVTLTQMRLLEESLADVADQGRPFIPSLRARADGRVEARIYPLDGLDGVLFSGSRATVLFTEGTVITDVRAAQASFYREVDPSGGVSLVLGAGNVGSIAPTDALHKLFVEGRVVLLKMNPINAYLGPILERAFAPLIDRGLLRVVYGGADVGGYLCEHPGIGDVHLTGSAETHDHIVWGPPGDERDRRKATNEPRLTKSITSELGNVSPVIVVPYLYARDELWYLARSVATQVVNNASFNCNAAKVLVLAQDWPQRDVFLGLIERALSSVLPRQAYYPGAFARYDALTAGRRDLFVAPMPPDAAGQCVPWTIVRDLDPSSEVEPLFTTEPFCGLLSVVSVGTPDPIEFLDAATDFCNERLWGTLSCAIFCHPMLEEDPVIDAALDRAILDLRYGAVAVNHWPAVIYALGATPWGGHPSATLADVQSGIGFVHNSQMLGRVEKSVIRGPMISFPKPPVFYDNRRMASLGRRLTSYAAAPTVGKTLGIVWSALRG
jgi:acyl-CoA reductase-like NAD-dependent aldehyde dehydrogenase